MARPGRGPRAVAYVACDPAALARAEAAVADGTSQSDAKYLTTYVRNENPRLRTLPLAGVHGRAEDLALLTPHPDCMLRALDIEPDRTFAAQAFLGSYDSITRAMPFAIDPAMRRLVKLPGPLPQMT